MTFKNSQEAALYLVNARELALAGAMLVVCVICGWGVAAAGAMVLPEGAATTLRLNAPAYKAIPVGMVLLMTLCGLTAILGEALCRTHTAKHLTIGAAVVIGAVVTWAWMAGVLPPSLGGRLLALPALLVAVVSLVTGLWMFCKITIEERTMSQRTLRLFSRTVGIVAIVVAVLAPLDLWLRVALIIGASICAALVEVALDRSAASAQM